MHVAQREMIALILAQEYSPFPVVPLFRRQRRRQPEWPLVCQGIQQRSAFRTTSGKTNRTLELPRSGFVQAPEPTPGTEGDSATLALVTGRPDRGSELARPAVLHKSLELLPCLQSGFMLPVVAAL